MSFDGVTRPTQLNPYQDPLSAYLGANEAERTERKDLKPVEETAKGNRVRRKDEEDNPEEQKDDRKQRQLLQLETMSEEEQALLKKFAQLRGLMNFSLESGTAYGLEINIQTGMVDIIARENGQRVLSLTLDEMMELSGRMERYAGYITDRAI